MIASLTRAMIAIQALTLATIALLLMQFAEWDWFTALLVSAALLLLLRSVLIVNNYLLSAAWHQPMSDGRAPAGLRLSGRILQEVGCSLLCWFRLFPFGWPFQVLVSGDNGVPVLMLHGYGANSGFWRPFARRLQEAGISHAAIDLEPVLAGIDDYAPAIEAAVQALRQTTGSPRVILLCHSMGGLAARAWLRAYGRASCERVITLGTPHFGSTLAGYGVGSNARQMRTPAGTADSWIARLNADEMDDTRTLFLSIYTRHDNIVSPQSSAVLPGAAHIALDLVGHVALGFDAGVSEHVLAEISSIRRNRSTAESR